MKLIELNKDQIIRLCLKYKVKSLAVFGSILTDRFNSNSDVDLLVDFYPEIDHTNYADNYFDLCEELESLLGRKVDLIDIKALRNPYFIKEVEQTQKIVYEVEQLLNEN